MTQSFTSTIIMGDFNAKHNSWGCDVDNRRGIYLSKHIERSGYRVLAPPIPTRYGHNSASTLDFAITLNVDWPCTVMSRSELSSDNNPVTIGYTPTNRRTPLTVLSLEDLTSGKGDGTPAGTEVTPLTQHPNHEAPSRDSGKGARITHLLTHTTRHD
ncbi:RNA-directed DNA polymerase from mobile element jockey [Trichonephila clavipes]|nr:RNA-directed DNA polymerase from mobile element jockey [Trichonephila clavipes]